MNNITKLAAGVAILSLFASAAAYANGGTGNSTASITATATVVQPVVITQTTPLSFGSFAAGASAGTIDTSGNVTGGVDKVTTGSPSTVTVSGLSGASYSVTGDPNVTLSDTVGNGPDMVATLAYPASSRTLTGGSDSFNISGNLAVGAAQPADPYQGLYNVSVHY